MFIFEVKYERIFKKAISRKIEVDDYYDLGEAWHIAIIKAIESINYDERIESISLIHDSIGD